MLACADRRVVVGPDDKITGLGAVATQFADELPVVTEHEWRPRLIGPARCCPTVPGVAPARSSASAAGLPRCAPSSMVPLGRPGRRPGKLHAGRGRLDERQV